MNFTTADRGEIASLLRRVLTLLQAPGADVGWSTQFSSVEQLRAHVAEQLRRVEAAELTEEEVRALTLLFAPTGALQEASLGSGWQTEFISLAERFDAAVHRR